MKTFSPIVALLVSVFLLIAGSALASLIVPLRAKIEGFPGSFRSGCSARSLFRRHAGRHARRADVIVQRAGHIRAFSAFVAASTVTVILLPIFLSPSVWLVMRGCLGFAFAGLYGVIESWINSKATNANRGSLYGVYQIVTFCRPRPAANCS